jgi:hypothetical protein
MNPRHPTYEKCSSTLEMDSLSTSINNLYFSICCKFGIGNVLNYLFQESRSRSSVLKINIVVHDIRIVISFCSNIASSAVQ